MTIEYAIEPFARPLDGVADAILDLTRHGPRHVLGGDAFAVESKAGIERGQARMRLERDAFGVGGRDQLAPGEDVAHGPLLAA